MTHTRETIYGFCCPSTYLILLNADRTAAALDLVKNVQVQAIIGPMTSAQAEFVIQIGGKSHVPIVSFSATSPSISPFQSPYFVRTTMNDSSQAECIASILDLYGWKEVVPIYENTPYGNGIIPYIVDELQRINARIPYRSVIVTSASDDQIRAELYKLKTMSTRVFVVHVPLVLSSRLFLLADEAGMMESGYVWILTDGVTDLLDALNSTVMESMQGVLGVRPHAPRSRRLLSFTARWKKRFRKENPEEDASKPSVYSLRAYDTVWALAMAAEKVGNSKLWFNNLHSKNNSTDLGTFGVSQTGPNLLKALKEIKFKGLAGEFQLVGGQVPPSDFQIVNVNGMGEKVIGFWKPGKGISRRVNGMLASSKWELPVIWPGEARYAPRGWQIPASGKKLKIGVPLKDGFKEFVNIEGALTDRPVVTGYCIDVFKDVAYLMPYAVQYEYVPFVNATGHMPWTYDELVHQVSAQVNRNEVAFAHTLLLPVFQIIHSRSSHGCRIVKSSRILVKKVLSLHGIITFGYFSTDYISIVLRT